MIQPPNDIPNTVSKEVHAIVKESKNAVLYDTAMKSIRDLFADTSVDQETTRSNLISIYDEIEIMIDSLHE